MSTEPGDLVLDSFLGSGTTAAAAHKLGRQWIGIEMGEQAFNMRVNTFLKRETLYSIPTANRGLIVLVIRKLLASSSYALIETFEVLRKRLEKLYQGTRSASAQEGFDLFWAYVRHEEA